MKKIYMNVQRRVPAPPKARRQNVTCFFIFLDFPWLENADELGDPCVLLLSGSDKTAFLLAGRTLDRGISSKTRVNISSFKSCIDPLADKTGLTSKTNELANSKVSKIVVTKVSVPESTRLPSKAPYKDWKFFSMSHNLHIS